MILIISFTYSFKVNKVNLIPALTAPFPLIFLPNLFVAFKAKLLTNPSFAEKFFSMNSNLDDSGISLPVFPSRTNLKLHISVTPKMVRKVVMNLDLSKASGRDCIPVVVLKNCEP